MQPGLVPAFDSNTRISILHCDIMLMRARLQEPEKPNLKDTSVRINAYGFALDAGPPCLAERPGLTISACPSTAPKEVCVPQAAIDASFLLRFRQVQLNT